MAQDSNAKQNIPPLFDEIMCNDREIVKTFSGPVITLSEGTFLLKRKRDLIRAAERALCWNKNKGNENDGET